ncbi:MAG: helix-turn-helix domain-containing protein [Spirochaetaceae bacterium]|jgi:two-component system response regulator YesN|nr:helix-turn-helix domain-containing protein [Spirochaetaceae bacterium]
MRVMIVDDEANIVKGLAFMIGKFRIPHCEVIPMTDAQEALLVLRKNPVDLIIVDLNMPDISGFTFIEEVQKLGSCRFVILSGYSEFSYAQKAIHLRVMEYLVKPVDELTLHRIISDTFREIYHLTPEDYTELSSLALTRDFCDFEGRETHYSKHMQDILLFIHKNISGDVSTTRLSDATGLHPNYISSLFVKEMHMGLHKYVQTLKLMKALHMLTDTKNTTIANIAAALGYTNERQFFRMFKKITGKTPGQFRREKI